MAVPTAFLAVPIRALLECALFCPWQKTGAKKPGKQLFFGCCQKKPGKNGGFFASLFEKKAAGKKR